MADSKPEFPTPEELEERFETLAQLYELGIALREVRFLDPEEQRAAERTRERLRDGVLDSARYPRPEDPPTK